MDYSHRISVSPKQNKTAAIEDPPDAVAPDREGAESSPSPPFLQLLEAANKLSGAIHADQDSDTAYNAIMDGKLVKFEGTAVGFSREPIEEYRCQGCWHYFKASGPKRRQEQTGACEIMRPSDGDTSVEPENSCRRWTADGITFPLL